jgi:hypothetical protein
MTYDCNLCRTVDGGTNGGGKSSGCAIAARGSGTAQGPAVALVLLGIALARRRWTRR